MSEALPAAPVLRVLTPTTTPEEVAAILAVLAGLSGGASTPARAVPGWSSPARRLGIRVPGPGAWKASALPR